MYNFKIEKIFTNGGATIFPKGINIIIGPNNSGKSQFLKDIKNTLDSYHHSNNKNIVIKDMEYVLPKSREDFMNRYDLSSKIFKTHDNQYYIRNYSGVFNDGIVVGNSFNNYLDAGNININDQWQRELDQYVLNFCNNEEILKNNEYAINSEAERFYSERQNSIRDFINIYGNLFFNYLGTEEKLLMCKRQKKYGLQDYNTNFLSEVQFNSELLNKLSRHTKQMFKKDIYLDRFSWGEFVLFRVGDNFDFIRSADRNNSDVEIKLQSYNMLDQEGDGIKSFITNYIALHMNDKNILLLDEPEAFLHPPLAKQLGEIIAYSSDNNKQIFISTHSVDLLKGILNVNKDINIIRITRDGNTNQFNLLEKEKIEDIISDPLLSSSNVLNGLFCEKVYICEAESDEEFYQSLHDKINSFDSSFFTHGKNKQTLKDISNTYRKLNIPNYRIYDFDILKDDDFNKALNGFVEEEKKNKYINIRKKINETLTKDDYKNGGVEKIQNEELKNEVMDMLEDLKKYGIIILKHGCLESSFSDLDILFTSNKSEWFKKSMTLINNSNKEVIESSYIYKWVFK